MGGWAPDPLQRELDVNTGPSRKELNLFTSSPTIHPMSAYRRLLRILGARAASAAT